METCVEDGCAVQTSRGKCRKHTREAVARGELPPGGKRIESTTVTHVERARQRSERAQSKRDAGPTGNALRMRRRYLRNRALAEQDYKCAICGSSTVKNWHLDHSHDNGLVRGTLCVPCNIRLNAIDDDEYMAKAIAYRDWWRAEHATNGGEKY